MELRSENALTREKISAVYLIGCDHKEEQTYQVSSGADAKHREFKRVLCEAIRNCIPDLIAEEYHPDLLKSRKRQSIALEVASEARICHRFCDLSESERLSRGIGLDFPWSWIPSHQILFQQPQGIGQLSDYEWHKHDIAHRFPIREDFWIAQLRDDVYRTVVFICGALHVPTFKERLQSKHINTIVIANFVGCDPSLTNTEAFNAREDVRKNGFPAVLIGENIGCFCTTQQSDSSAALSDLE